MVNILDAFMNQHYTNSVLGVMLFKMGRLRKSKFCDQSQAEEIQIQKKKKKKKKKQEQGLNVDL